MCICSSIRHTEHQIRAPYRLGHDASKLRALVRGPSRCQPSTFRSSRAQVLTEASAHVDWHIRDLMMQGYTALANEAPPLCISTDEDMRKMDEAQQSIDSMSLIDRSTISEFKCSVSCDGSLLSIKVWTCMMSRYLFTLCSALRRFQSLPWLLTRRLCGQVLVSPQSLHLLHWRSCGQMPVPPQSFQSLLRRLCLQMLVPPQSMHLLLWQLCSHFGRSALLRPCFAAAFPAATRRLLRPVVLPRCPGPRASCRARGHAALAVLLAVPPTAP